MSRPTPRRRTSSWIPTSRPRKIAGQTPAADGHPADAHAVDAQPADAAAVDVRPVEAPTGDVHTVEAPTTDPPRADAPTGSTTAQLLVQPAQDRSVRADEPAHGGLLASKAATKTLIAVLAVLTVLLLLQSAWWVRHVLRDEPEQTTAEDDTIAVPADHPIVPTTLAVQEGVEAAAKAAQTVVAVNYKDYDQEVDEAAELMTDDFAEEYRRTTADIRQEFVARKTVIEARVVAQGAVRANDTELEALVFLNQYVVRGKGEGARTVYTPYRALITMVHTDEGWLVDNLDTK